jgi:hypothetical protein
MGFKRFDPEDLTISNAAVTTAAWSNNVPTLTEYFVDPAQTGSASSTSEYYYNVYQQHQVILQLQFNLELHIVIL